MRWMWSLYGRVCWRLVDAPLRSRKVHHTRNDTDGLVVGLFPVLQVLTRRLCCLCVCVCVAAEKCIQVLLELIQTKVNYVVAGGHHCHQRHLPQVPQPLRVHHCHHCARTSTHWTSPRPRRP